MRAVMGQVARVVRWLPSVVIGADPGRQILPMMHCVCGLPHEETEAAAVAEEQWGPSHRYCGLAMGAWCVPGADEG